METYWCCKKNSIIDNYLKPDFNPALIPCIQDKCPRWKEWEGRGGCILLIKEGKTVKSHLFSDAIKTFILVFCWQIIN